MITPPSGSPDLPARYQNISSTPMKGGFGFAWVVRDTYLDRDVLYKQIQHKSHNTQLLNEIQNISKARSRHVVEIYDIIKDTDGDVSGIIIEYLTGRDYSTFWTEAKGNITGYLRILFQIAAALADLHSYGISHRDIKLDNIKESSSGILKIFDFGISTPTENYFTSENRGTLVYGGPELYELNAKISSKTDIYAFGVCAWSLASQHFPKSLLETPPQSTSRVESIESALPGLLPSEIVTVINNSLNPDPELRPTALQICKIFKKYLVMGLHKGVFVRGTQTIFELSAAHKFVRIKIANQGEMSVRYDDLVFRVESVSGDVFINNDPVTAGAVLHDSCLVSFGSTNLGISRTHIPFFSSNPEVIL